MEEVRTMKPLRTLYGHMTAVTAMTFSPDGFLMASGCSRGWVNIWSLSVSWPVLGMLSVILPLPVSILISDQWSDIPAVRLPGQGSTLRFVWLSCTSLLSCRTTSYCLILVRLDKLNFYKTKCKYNSLHSISIFNLRSLQ